MMPPVPVQIRTGVDGKTQQCHFQNATLQTAGDAKTAFSIAMYVDVPADRAGDLAVAAHLATLFAALVEHAKTLGIDIAFEAEVGEDDPDPLPHTDDDDDQEVD